MNNMYSNYLNNDPFIRTFMTAEIDDKILNGLTNNLKDANINNDSIFVNSTEGFLRGNMQKGTYVPYKNLTIIKPVITNDRNQMLYKIQEVSFAAHDANLYLDTHPEDTNMIMLYNKYLKEEKMLNDEYEKKYGPIDLSDEQGLNLTPWSWIKEPWPWNK